MKHIFLIDEIILLNIAKYSDILLAWQIGANMRSCELVTLVTAIACGITECYSNEELPVIAAIFTQLGDTIATILAQEEFCNDVTEK